MVSPRQPNQYCFAQNAFFSCIFACLVCGAQHSQANIVLHRVLVSVAFSPVYFVEPEAARWTVALNHIPLSTTLNALFVQV